MNLQNHPYYNYYEQDGKKFPSKIMSYYASYLPPKKKEDIAWRLHHFENNLENLNLLEEPIEDLQQLYIQRAQYLRDNYEYLILNYSGGPDSHNILETFMLNGIFLDEILIYSYFDEPTIDKLHHTNPSTFSLFPEFYEAEKSALPIAKYLVERYSPHTKITFVNNLYEVHKKFWETITEEDFIKSVKGNASILMSHRHIGRVRDPNFKQSWKDLKQRKKTAHIWGIEKPGLKSDNKGIFVRLLDHTILSRIDLQYLLTSEDIPNIHELFYIHPDFVKLFLKQCHVLVNNFSPTFFNQLSTRMHENSLAKILYNIKTPSLYSGLKIPDLLSRYEELPILKEMSKTGIIPGCPDMGEPIFVKLYLDDRSSTASINYDRFLSFLQNTLFSKFDRKILVHTLTSGMPSKKYYIKYF